MPDSIFKKTSPWNQPIHFFETLTSTNDFALELGEGGAPEGSIVIAEKQTRGRGQLRRPWISPKGKGVYISFLLRLSIEQNTIRSLSQIGVVSLFDAILASKIIISNMKIKAPNDLLIDGKKVAGVLVETRLGASSFAVVGIGVNINHQTEDFPSKIPYEATSLTLSSTSIINRQILLEKLIQAFYERYQELLYCPEKLDQVWKSRLESYKNGPR